MLLAGLASQASREPRAAARPVRSMGHQVQLEMRLVLKTHVHELVEFERARIVDVVAFNHTIHLQRDGGLSVKVKRHNIIGHISLNALR
jgi:hypothetical protein